MTAAYQDRCDAGRQLARHLSAPPGTVVLGIPRGGVVVAAEVARALGAPLDVIVARKVGAPTQPELALGAVTADGATCLNDEVIAMLGVPPGALAAAIERERLVAEEREVRLRGIRAPVPLAGATVIVVDDGLATGATMRAAVRAVRRTGAAQVIVAVPLGAPDTVAAMRGEADAVVCPLTPAAFRAVGEHYAVFDQTSDEEVAQRLREA